MTDVPTYLSRSEVPVVIPSVHPDETLPWLVRSLFEGGVGRIVVVDDGSGPEYSPHFAACRALGAHVITHETNLGKGNALKDAFVYLLSLDDGGAADQAVRGCVTADADGQHAPQDILTVWRRFRRLEGEPLVLGVRDMRREGVPRQSRLGNTIINGCLRLFCGLRITDSQTGLRGVPRQLMERCLSLEGDHYEFETQMILTCHRDTPVVEVPIATIFDSEERHKTHFDPVVDSWRVLFVVVRSFIRFAAASLGCTAVDLVLFTLLSLLFRRLGVGMWAALATYMARAVSASLNFAINRRTVFGREGSVRTQVARFVVVAVIQVTLSAATVQAVAPLFAHGSVVVIKAVVDLVLFLVNYQVQMRLVFGGGGEGRQ